MAIPDPARMHFLDMLRQTHSVLEMLMFSHWQSSRVRRALQRSQILGFVWAYLAVEHEVGDMLMVTSHILVVERVQTRGVGAQGEIMVPVAPEGICKGFTHFLILVLSCLNEEWLIQFGRLAGNSGVVDFVPSNVFRELLGRDRLADWISLGFGLEERGYKLFVFLDRIVFFLFYTHVPF